MGFRNKAYAKVWDIKPVSNTRTDLRITISRKNQESGEFEEEFAGFVSCYGTAAASKAAKLTKGSRICLGDVDVTNHYDKKNKVTYTNYKVFSFEENGAAESGSAPAPNAAPVYTREPQPREYDGEVDDSSLPF